MKSITILAIESSCDETAAAVYETSKGILSNELFSQIELHKPFGGVMPEIASRSHLEKIGPIVQAALDRAGKTLDNIDAIGVTNRPGLPGSLLIGLSFAKALAYAKGKPLIGVNHLEGHAFSSLIEHKVPFPHICLTASGGHTALYLVKGLGDYTILGQTIDDAAGEAFDKISKLIELGYPGGPIIEQYANETGFQDYFHYPRGNGKTLNFSFSGLKTAVLYDLVKQGAYDLQSKTLLKPDDLPLKERVASSLLVCVGDIFKQKIKLAKELHPEIAAVTFVGGVACNKYLKTLLQAYCLSRSMEFYAPSPAYCTDNAAMIAFVAHYKAQQGHYDNLSLDIY